MGDLWDLKIDSSLEAIEKRDKAGKTYFDRLEYLSRNSDTIEIDEAIRLCCDLRWAVGEIHRLQDKLTGPNWSKMTIETNRCCYCGHEFKPGEVMTIDMPGHGPYCAKCKAERDRAKLGTAGNPCPHFQATIAKCAIEGAVCGDGDQRTATSCPLNEDASCPFWQLTCIRATKGEWIKCERHDQTCPGKARSKS